MEKEGFTNVNWNLYRSFITVYEMESYSAAADILHVTRPAIRQNVRELGKQLGAELFISHAKGVTPTHEGIQLYKKVEPLVTQMYSVERDFSDFTEETPATIRMIVSSSFVAYFLTEFLTKFSKKYKSIRFELYLRAHSESRELLAQRKIDIVIDIEDVVRKFNLDSFDIMTVRSIIVASKSFLAENKLGKRLTLKEFSAMPIICHTWMMDLIKIERGKINPFIKTSNLEPVFHLVADNVGIGIIPRVLFDKLNLNKEVEELEISGVEIVPHKIVCGYNVESLSKPAEIFVDELRTFFR